jgi:hypothetical protein
MSAVAMRDCGFISRFRKVTAMSLACLLGFGATVGEAAQRRSTSNILAQTPPAPFTPPIFTTLSQNDNAKLFFAILQASGLSREDFGRGDVVFFVPRDTTCTSAEVAYLRGLTEKGPARAYVLSHAFKGELGIFPDNRVGYIRRASYLPNKGTMDSRFGIVGIDEAHPFSLPLLNGTSVLVSIKDGTLRIGARSRVLTKENGASDGDKMELDQCAVY